jgi:hypothetical protein
MAGSNRRDAMSSYEELVVDRGVDHAWMQFRLRLADHLAAASRDVPVAIAITPQAADDEAPALILEADGTDLVARIETAGQLDARFRFTASERRLLVDLGMTIEDGGPVLLLDAHEIDRAAHYVYAVLHEMWDVVHPSFLAIDPEDLGLVDEPERDEEGTSVEVPSIIHPTSIESLNEWVDAALAPGFGHTPIRDGDGDICVHGQGSARAIVSVRSENRIEVWSILAREVDVAKAHREIDRLSQQYIFHRFFIVDDMLVVSMVLFADPFVPAHLHAALQGTLYVSGRLAGPAKRLEKPRSRGNRNNTAADLDPRLMSLFVSGRRMQTAELVSTAVKLAKGSEATLQAWRERSIAAHAQAKKLFGEQGDVNDVHRWAVSSWRRVIRAIDLALADVSTGSREAS